MQIETCLLTQNSCYQKNLEKADRRYTNFQQQGPQGVMIHSTGANNPNLRRYLAPDDGRLGSNTLGNHWNQAGLTKCVHAMIGLDKDGQLVAYQCLPWNFRGWHCGSTGNNSHVSIEICEDDGTDPQYARRCFDLAVELTAWLCQAYGLDPEVPGVILDHAEGYRLGIASNHADTANFFGPHGLTMDQFRAAVAAKGKEVETMTKEELEGFVDERIRVLIPVYRTLEEVPDWGKATVEAMVARGDLVGEGDGLNLSRDLLRTLVVLERMR